MSYFKLQDSSCPFLIDEKTCVLRNGEGHDKRKWVTEIRPEELKRGRCKRVLEGVGPYGSEIEAPPNDSGRVPDSRNPPVGERELRSYVFDEGRVA